MSQPQDKFVAANLKSSQHLELYHRIQAFEIDEPNVSLPFSQRLARENHWSLAYSQQVIEEYKKFLFLAIVTDCPIVPSEAVDKAWHLHLTYTHSYWDDLCAQVLQKPLHHCPTKGGASQRELFWECYGETLNLYETVFRCCPPVEIWQPPIVRFRQPEQFKRVSSQDYWLVPKPSLKLSKLVSLRIFHQSWLRVIISALLGFELVLSLHLLATTTGFDVINLLIDQPAFAQVSPHLNQYTPSQPKVSGWVPMWVVLIGSFLFFLILGTILQYLNSWCPKCKRYGLVKETTHVHKKSTETDYGERRITRVCQCCKFTEQRYESIPKGSDSDFSCAWM